MEPNSVIYLKSSINLLEPKVSGYPPHFEIHLSGSDICWNLEDQHFPKPRTLEVASSWLSGLVRSLVLTRKSLLKIEGITISTKFSRTSYFEMRFTLELLELTIEEYRQPRECILFSCSQ